MVWHNAVIDLFFVSGPGIPKCNLLRRAYFRKKNARVWWERNRTESVHGSCCNSLGLKSLLTHFSYTGGARRQLLLVSFCRMFRRLHKVSFKSRMYVDFDVQNSWPLFTMMVPAQACDMREPRAQPCMCARAKYTCVRACMHVGVRVLSARDARV